MMEQIPINTKEEYQEAVKRGFEPLLDMRFKMDIRLRVEIQTELFGRGRIDTMRANEKFFRWVWNHKPHYCEETMKPLKTYSAVYCSHILTRGAFPEMATDPRNINLYIRKCTTDGKTEIVKGCVYIGRIKKRLNY